MITNNFAERHPSVAVHPEFFLELRDIYDLIYELGPYMGRYAVNFPRGKWLERFVAHLDLLKPVERAAAKAKIKQIEQALFSVSVSYDESLCWEDNIQKLAATHSLKTVIGDGIDPGPFTHFSVALPQLRENRRTSWRLGGAWEDYFFEIRPLLLGSPSAYLIDPYFDPFDPRKLKLLSRVMDEIKQSVCYAVHVITRLELNNMSATMGGAITPNNLKDKLHSHYENEVGRSRQLLFHFVTDVAELDMHNRFFLTSAGAIDFGKGFFIKDVLAAIPQLDANIVGETHHRVLKQTFIDGVSRFSETIKRVPGIAYPAKVVTHKIFG